jgi:hypothetical protein
MYEYEYMPILILRKFSANFSGGERSLDLLTVLYLPLFHPVFRLSVWADVG